MKICSVYNQRLLTADTLLREDNRVQLLVEKYSPRTLPILQSRFVLLRFFQRLRKGFRFALVVKLHRFSGRFLAALCPAKGYSESPTVGADCSCVISCRRNFRIEFYYQQYSNSTLQLRDYSPSK